MSTTRLLVSVRSLPEALAALAGGADLIDVKEPALGSLGRARDATIAAIVQALAGRRPVSAALGELLAAASCPVQGLAYAKWGLAGAAGIDWPAALQAAISQCQTGCQPVVAGYADWERAAAPPLDCVVEFARIHGRVLLVDTCVKDGATLLDHLPLPRIAGLIESCRQAGVSVALAGALGRNEIERLLPCRPDWIAVRGAVCRGGRRDGEVDEEKVQDLARLCQRGQLAARRRQNLQQSAPAAGPGFRVR